MIFVAFLLAFVACEEVDVYVRPESPAGWADLYDMYNRGIGFRAVDKQSSTWLFTFADESQVALRPGELMMQECEAEVSGAVVAWDADGQWLVDGSPTGIRRESATDANALPVYLLYVPESLIKVHLSNGRIIKLKYEAPAPTVPEGEIPTIYLTTAGGAPIVSKEDYVEGTLRLSNPDRRFGGVAEFSGSMRIRGRGNSTWGMPKKSYKIKMDSKTSFFGMTKDKEWCLLANYCDKSLLRNITAMELSRRMGFSWTPRMVPVELYLNGKYAGVYTFCEHKKVAPHRVNIDLEAGDLLFEMDQSQDEPVSWYTQHGAPMMFSEPSEPSEEQIAFAKNYFYEFEKALWAKDFAKAYSYIDLPSFVDNYIIQELTKNVDGNLRKSSFITLPKDGVLEMYHVWDFDISMGNCDYYGDGQEAWKGWWVKEYGAYGYHHGWYYRMFMDPEFVQMVKARWSELYPEIKTIPEYIDEQCAGMKDAPARNFRTWNILGIYVWPNAKVTGSYEGEVAWLKEAYSKRLEWLNMQIRGL